MMMVLKKVQFTNGKVPSDANGHVGIIKVRNHIRQARNDLLDNITLYDAEKQQTLKHLEIYDCKRYYFWIYLR